MKKVLVAALVAVGLIAATPRPAAADATIFWGFSSTPTNRAARGFAVGISLIVVGFEFEYANTSEDALKAAPGLRTGMFNGLLQTPTKMQLYVTAGGGFFRERFNDVGETNFGTNIGGGVKIPLFGPLRIRVDYRVFNLRGSDTVYMHPQRFYVGGNIAF